jgi:hypothetical protein
MHRYGDAVVGIVIEKIRYQLGYFRCQTASQERSVRDRDGHRAGK